MLSTKNYNNNSSLFANTGKFNSIEADNIYNKTETDLLINSIDLTNYYIKSEVDTKFNNAFSLYYTRLYIDSTFTGYYTKTQTAFLQPF